MLKPIAKVGSLTFSSRILGYFRDLLIASTFGNTGVSDIFFQAFRLPNIFRSFFAEGALNAAFVPIFTKVYHQDRQKALLFVCEIFTILAGFLTGMVLVFEAAMPLVMKLIAPGFQSTPEKLDLAINFGRILFPYILFISLSALCAGVLNSISRFSAAAAAPILLNLFCIFSLIFFNHSIIQAGYALSFACLLAGIAQLIWMKRACKRIHFSIRFIRPTFSSNTLNFLKKLLPGIVSSGTYQINMIFSTLVASYVPLAISYLAYADRINQFPLSIIGIAIGTVLLPTLTRYVSEENQEKALFLQNRSLQFALFLSIPAALAFYTLSLPIVITLFQHGRFTYDMSLEVSKVLSIYAFCLPSNVITKIFSTSFFARGNTKKPMHGSVLSILVNFLGIAIFFPLFSYYGIAYAGVAASWMNTLFLGFSLLKDKNFSPDDSLKTKLFRIFLAGLLMTACLNFLQTLVLPFLGKRFLIDLVVLIGLIGCGVITYLLSALLFKGITLKTIKQDFLIENF